MTRSGVRLPSAPPGITQASVFNQLLLSGLPQSAIVDVPDKRSISSPAGTGRGSHMRACGGPVARSRSAAAQPRRGRVSCPGADLARSRVLPPGSKAIRSDGARAFSSEDLIVGWHGLRTDRTGSIESNRVTGRDIIERTNTQNGAHGTWERREPWEPPRRSGFQISAIWFPLSLYDGN